MTRAGHAFTGTRDIFYVLAGLAFGGWLITLGHRWGRP